MVATMATGTSAAHQSSVHQISAASAAPMPTVRKLSRRFTRGGESSAPGLETAGFLKTDSPERERRTVDGSEHQRPSCPSGADGRKVALGPKEVDDRQADGL
jgi:hypothetical protein